MTVHRLLAAALVAATPFIVMEARAVPRPVPAAPKSKSENAMAASRKALDEVGDMNYQARPHRHHQRREAEGQGPGRPRQPGLPVRTRPGPAGRHSQPEAGQAPRRSEGGGTFPYNLKFGLTAEGVSFPPRKASSPGNCGLA